MVTLVGVRFAAPLLAAGMALSMPRAGAAQAGGDSVRVPVVLRTVPSVRSAGLHGAGAAIVGNAGAVFSNPAGGATIRNIAVEGAYETAPADGYMASAAVAWKLAQFDLGFGLRGHDPGTMPLIPGAPPASAAGSREWLGVGSLVYRFGLIALGASGKYVRQRVGDVVEEGTSGDFGLAIAVFDIMALGFSMQNVGGNWRSNSVLSMPRLTRTGFTMNYVDPQGTVRLLSTIEYQWPADAASRLVLAGEGGVVYGEVGVLGRVAYRSRTGGTAAPAVVYGATLRLGVAEIDAALEPTDVVGERATRRIGMRIAF